MPAAPAPAPAPAPPVVPPPPAPALPDELMAACERYAYGSREELATNYARAAALHAAGKTPREIVAVIRQGADVDALFVG